MSLSRMAAKAAVAATITLVLAGASRGSSESRGDSTTAERAVWCRLSADPRGKATRFWWCVLSAIALVTAGEALAQTPGRYVQRDIVQKLTDVGGWSGTVWEFRVQAVDVLPDRSFRLHLIITNGADRGSTMGFVELNKIQLVSDSLERVTLKGKPRGQWVTNSSGQIQFASQDSVRIVLDFPPFENETKLVNLVFYQQSLGHSWPVVQLKNIAVFAEK